MMTDKTETERQEDEKTQGRRGGVLKENTTEDEMVAQAEDELGLQPKTVKNALLHGPDYDEVEES